MDKRRRRRVPILLILAVCAFMLLTGFTGVSDGTAPGSTLSTMKAETASVVEGAILEKYAASLSDQTAQVIEAARAIAEDDFVIGRVAAGFGAEKAGESGEEKAMLEEYFVTHTMVNPELVTISLNVRDNPGMDGEVIGKLYPDCGGEILDIENGWVKLSSGNVTGWVSEDYMLFGDDAADRAEEVGAFEVTVTSESLNLRGEKSTDSWIVDFALEGDRFPYVAGAGEDWITVQYSDTVQAYVASDYVDVDFEYPEGVTLEEEQERYAAELAAEQAAEEAAAKEAEAKAAEEKAAADKAAAEKAAADAAAASAARAAASAAEAKAGQCPSSPNRCTTTVSEQEAREMAAVVWIESGNEGYEGKLAVANVILNRLYAGWAGSVHDVIFAPGQFYGSDTGLISSYAENPDSSCLQAVYDALAGYNNVGGYLYFCSLAKAQAAGYTDCLIIGKQCFH